MEVAATVGAAAGLVEVTSKFVNLTISACGSARDMLVEQFGQVVIRRELVKQGEAILENMVVDSYAEDVFQASDHGVDRKTAELTGETLSERLTFSSCKEEQKRQRERFVKQFNLKLRMQDSKFSVYKLVLDAPDEQSKKLTINFGYVVIVQVKEGVFDIEYAVYEAVLQVSNLQEVTDSKKLRFFKKTLRKITGESKNAPFLLRAKDPKILSEGIMKQWAMDRFMETDRSLIKSIKYDDDNQEEGAPA